MPRRMAFDPWLFFTTGLLVLGGLLMVGSASYYFAMSLGVSPYHYLLRHAVHVSVGAAAFAGALHLSYRKLDDRRLVLSLLVISGALLVLVLLMPATGGAQRWLRFGPLTVQPSEIAKLSAIVFASWLLSRHEDRVNDLGAVAAPCLAGVGPLLALVVIEPDLGSAFILAVAVSVLIFVAGLRWKYIGVMVGGGVAALAALVVAAPYRVQRVMTFLQPDLDTQGTGFQLAQSLIAVGRGGVTGTGLGQGLQKAFYLPAAHTDFIFSVIGEEFGLLGTGLVLAAFLLLFWRGLRAALRAPDRFGFYLALGFTTLLVVQGLTHMAVCLGLLPTKGLPLPLISYGGSSLITTLVAMGVLLNVSQHSN